MGLSDNQLESVSEISNFQCIDMFQYIKHPQSIYFNLLIQRHIDILKCIETWVIQYIETYQYIESYLFLQRTLTAIPPIIKCQKSNPPPSLDRYDKNRMR